MIRSPYGWKDEPKLVTRYIVTEKEWKNTELLCQRVLAKNKECKFANSILTYHKPYVKSYETEPDMPENSHSFCMKTKLDFLKKCASVCF